MPTLSVVLVYLARLRERLPPVAHGMSVRAIVSSSPFSSVLPST
jgi:hypothetical protein